MCKRAAPVAPQKEPGTANRRQTGKRERDHARERRWHGVWQGLRRRGGRHGHLRRKIDQGVVFAFPLNRGANLPCAGRAQVAAGVFIDPFTNRRKILQFAAAHAAGWAGKPQMNAAHIFNRLACLAGDGQPEGVAADAARADIKLHGQVLAAKQVAGCLGFADGGGGRQAAAGSAQRHDTTCRRN